MAPASATPAGGARRFPRPRGDGPRRRARCHERRRVPPPTRGWPLRHDPLTGDGPGSPAHAGMAPFLARLLGVFLGFPRPRGDGPGREEASPSLIPGSPAHAGMAPALSGRSSRNSGFPRPRGDGPAVRCLGEPIDAVPPPTRGWPRLDHGPRRVLLGSPAHAGMACSATIWVMRARQSGW